MRSMFRNKLSSKKGIAPSSTTATGCIDEGHESQQQQRGGDGFGIDTSIRTDDDSQQQRSKKHHHASGSNSSSSSSMITTSINTAATGMRSSKSSSGKSGGNSNANNSNLISSYRRGAIRASAFAHDDKSYDPTAINRSNIISPKNDASRLLIYNAIKDNILFRSSSSNNQQQQQDATSNVNNNPSSSIIQGTGETDEEQFRDLIDAFTLRNCYPGEIVIAEGAQGDGFYVLARGVVEVFESSEFRGRLYPGTGFGEIALLYGCPRTATVRAALEDSDNNVENGGITGGIRQGDRSMMQRRKMTPQDNLAAAPVVSGGCQLWFMDRRAFRAIMARHKRKRLNMKLMLLEKVRYTKRDR